MSLFLLKHSQFEPTFSLKDVLIHLQLHVYCNVPKFLPYTFIWPYMFIDFLKDVLPTRLFGPTLVLGTLEYAYKIHMLNY